MSINQKQTEEELKWKLRESKPEYQFSLAMRDLRNLKHAEQQLSHLSTTLRDAFCITVREVKDRLFKLIDEL